MQSPKSFLGQNASSQYKKITSSLVNNSSSSTTMQASKFEGNSFRLMLLTLMVLQNSATVLVGRYTRSSVPKEEMFIVGNFVLTTEFTKVSFGHVSCNITYYWCVSLYIALVDQYFMPFKILTYLQTSLVVLV